jgi:hypothetical protein
VKNNGDKEGSSKETGGEEDREEDRKEEIRKVLGTPGWRRNSPALFFCALQFAVFSRYKTRFRKKIQEKYVTS